MGGARSMHGDDKCAQYSGQKHRRDNLDLKGTGWKGVDWIHLDKDKGQWQALVNKVMELWVP